VTLKELEIEIVNLKERLRLAEQSMEIHLFYSNPDWKPGERWHPKKR
jgi:hypothetical protein